MDLSKYIDHTILKPTTLIADVEKLCNEAKQFGFAAVCVPPNFVEIAKKNLEGSEVKIATVIGFPFGYSAVEAKVAEILMAIVDGVDELDIVSISRRSRTTTGCTSPTRSIVFSRSFGRGIKRSR
jgi:deoxyribose-phosphate aldolase